MNMLWVSWRTVGFYFDYLHDLDKIIATRSNNDSTEFDSVELYSLYYCCEIAYLNFVELVELCSILNRTVTTDRLTEPTAVDLKKGMSTKEYTYDWKIVSRSVKLI